MINGTAGNTGVALWVFWPMFERVVYHGLQMKMKHFCGFMACLCDEVLWWLLLNLCAAFMELRLMQLLETDLSVLNDYWDFSKIVERSVRVNASLI